MNNETQEKLDSTVKMLEFMYRKGCITYEELLSGTKDAEEEAKKEWREMFIPPHKGALPPV